MSRTASSWSSEPARKLDFPQPVLRIIGTRGIPAAHGGFETFAEHLALYLVERGWRVVVYCQEDGCERWHGDLWHRVERIRVPIRLKGPAGTILFDWKAIRHAAKRRDLCLTLGYNTALFCTLLRIKHTPNVINMDGIEWSRSKWGRFARAWLWLNDWAGCFLGDHLVADHPEIRRHLATRVDAAKITMIPYGAERVSRAGSELVSALGLQPDQYLLVVARPEPENSLLEIVTGFSARRRGVTLAILGSLSDTHPYHRAVRAAGSDEVRFLGAIYEKSVVQELRANARIYIHGHQVGGTNPSLVEAMGAGCAVIAHANRFNRWVAGEKTLYFNGSTEFGDTLEQVIEDRIALEAMRESSRVRFEANFSWGKILSEYHALLCGFLPDRT